MIREVSKTEFGKMIRLSGTKAHRLSIKGSKSAKFDITIERASACSAGHHEKSYPASRTQHLHRPRKKVFFV